MTHEIVKWFNSQKGFGCIQHDDGSKDAFVHISAVERAGLRGLTDVLARLGWLRTPRTARPPRGFCLRILRQRASFAASSVNRLAACVASRARPNA